MDIQGFAYIVGGGSGIGKETAVAFAREGAAGVAIADLNIEAAEESANLAKSAATNPEFKVSFFHIDVVDEESVDKGTKQVVDLFGRIDYLLVAAGIGVMQAMCTTEFEPSFFKKMMDINVVGSWMVTRSVGAVMKNQSFTPTKQRPERAVTRGTIVHMGSSASYTAAPGTSPYSTSKHAVLGMSRTASVDLVRHGIRVNCLCPGWVDTPLVQKAREQTPGLDDMIKKVVPMGRIAMAEETADAIIYLSSPKSSYVTGCALALDAGTIVAIQSGV